ncbi:MAG: Hsp70 family protein [Clostridia bacterium]|nr:Hsp70 family protein [Clostridia bacterium]
MRILGFDLGDGESAVTLLDENSTIEPRVIPLCGRASTLTAVGLRDGQIVIGEDASVMSGAVNVQTRFKAKYLSDPSASGVVRMFAQGVLAQLMREEPALMANVSATVVGCPAGWGQGRREQYAALLESAGFPNVSVVPEPRAAFLYVRHARGLRIDPALMKKSAMVVDVGSSTTDFAYVVDGRQQNLSLFGDTNLGGGVLDELILERALSLSPDGEAIRRVFEKSAAWKSFCELEARRLKEAYFLDEKKWETQPLSRQLVICYDETLMLDIRLDAAQMQEIIHMPAAQLGGRSFVKCLDDALAAAQAVSRENPPQAVILTGGASRMTFLREAVGAAFEKSLLISCPEPECSIARGLAYAGCVDEKLRIFRSETASIARGERLSLAVSQRIHELYRPLANAIFDVCMECALDSVRLWRQGGLDTIDALEAHCQERIAREISGNDVREAVQEPMKAWLTMLLETLEDELTALCERCGVPSERMTLGSANVHAGVGVKLSVLDAMGMDVLSGLLSVVLAAVGAAICGGGGMAVISSGPLGLILGAVIGVLLMLLGRDTMEHALRSANLPGFLRFLVSDLAVRLGMDRQRQKIEASIIGALADPSNGFSARLCAGLADTIGVQLEAMAKNAEMSIEA